jgi:transcriptional regulator with XRE-family HTH domain
MANGMFRDGRATDREYVGQQFRSFRAKALLSQRELGERIGLWQQSVSQIENQRVTCYMRTYMRFRDFANRMNDESQTWPNPRTND